MRTYLFKFILAVLVMSAGLSATAADQQASKEEAVALVKKAVGYVRKNGKDKALAEFSRPQSQFVDREL
ncbi:MAG: histidine kinase, partial [Pseudomonadota bacterium]